MALYWKTKALLAKIQPTALTDPVPTNVANGMMVKNLSVKSMEGREVSRDLERNFYGAQESFIVGEHVIVSFEVELVGHATRGTAPAWSAVARACGLAEVVSAGTSVVYNPVSSGHSLATLYYFHAGYRQIITDCRGDAQVVINANEIPVLKVTLTGLYQKPTDTAGIVPTVSAFQAPMPSTKANTTAFSINGVSLAMRNYQLAFGNQVERIFLAGPAAGSQEICIVDSMPAVTCQIQAVPLATFDPFALAAANTSVPMSVVHGFGSGKITSIAKSNCRILRPDEPVNAQGTVEWPIRISPLPTSGNDSFTITLT